MTFFNNIFIYIRVPLDQAEAGDPPRVLESEMHQPERLLILRALEILRSREPESGNLIINNKINLGAPDQKR